MAKPLTRADLGIWLINLDRDADRRANMERQLDAMGLNYMRFPAIYGKDHVDALAKRADAAAYARNMGSPILPGKMGCYASHIAVWEAFVASDREVALILEDDVIFHDDFLDSLDIALAGSAHWDTLRFNCVRAKLPVSQGRLGRYTLNAYIGPFTGNATYLLKKDVAQRILPNLWPQTRAFDHELNRFFKHDFRQFGLEPFSSHVDDGNVSSITGTNFALVGKFKWYHRLRHYRLKAMNYFRRAAWLARKNRLLPRRTPMQLNQE
ncbi:glycosyltransferase family 25 protein [Cognatiyoonia sp. IB215182]|uniref:glycosyltransferase family 25 protein n=1 Tax=Cognatiyoonia sp. IB215182 TaxID=3097353 RepID=UPI002A0F191C|nr:glycosyltransferase family 25 protein [Cognatiyoonia sp. IB215182]MDX8350977.1 glycosyltransferase family 25 protein [Cognatiyoonia sp. IB215182]